jgi:hypothetical protein
VLVLRSFFFWREASHLSCPYADDSKDNNLCSLQNTNSRMGFHHWTINNDGTQTSPGSSQQMVQGTSPLPPQEDNYHLLPDMFVGSEPPPAPFTGLSPPANEHQQTSMQAHEQAYPSTVVEEASHRRMNQHGNSNPSTQVGKTCLVFHRAANAHALTCILFSESY